MIVTRTPFRVTLGGGGTDLPSFYRRHGGFIFAMGIDKYMYIMLNPPTVDNKIRLHYSRSEIADDIDELQHELARDALRLHGIRNKIEVSSMADLPDGTGLGSSSSYLVGLLTALHHYRREYVPLQVLAEEACHIELDVLGKPIGKQDQYMAAYGGLTVLDIDRDGSVQVRSVGGSPAAHSAFVANTHLYYTGLRRSAVDVLRDILDLAGKRVVCICSGGNFDFERLPEVKERAQRFSGLKRYFILRMPQRPGALRDFLQLLGPEDDIARFEYLKKSARNFGSVLIGIETTAPENLARLCEKLEAAGIGYRDITRDPVLAEFLI